MNMGRLFWKLFLSFFLAMVLSFFGVVAYFTLIGEHREEYYIPAFQASLMLTTAEEILTHSGVEPLLPVLKKWNAEAKPPHLTVIDGNGKVLTDPTFSADGTRRQVAALNGENYSLITDIEAVDTLPRQHSFSVPLASGAVIGFLFSLFLAWYLSRPLRHLRWALHSVAEGKFDTRVQPLMGSRRDEIVDLAHDFDSMAAQLQQLVEARQRLLHDISHELRSPLTRLQVAIGLLRQNPARTEVMLERIDHESERLNTLVEQVLTLARIEVGTGVVPRERVDLIELIAEIAADASFEAEATGRGVNIKTKGSFVSNVNGEILCRAFENIIRNAVKFTAPGTYVDVEAAPDAAGQNLCVSVEDHGPGVPPDMLAKIFEPFLRVETEQPAVGFGLGLAIAHRAILSHNGQIQAETPAQGGLRIKIIVPKTHSSI